MKKAAFAGTIFFISSSSALFAGGEPDRMRTSGLTSQPIGHHLYCKHYYRDCNILSLKMPAPVLTQERWQELVDVNAFSNNTIKPVTDLDFYKQEEHWTYPVDHGDCEDYVLMKRKILMRLGWPASALLITVVKQANGEGHAVLTVRTRHADFILDNLEPKIKKWHQTPYKYLKRQAIRHSGKWVDIVDARKKPVP